MTDEIRKEVARLLNEGMGISPGKCNSIIERIEEIMEESAQPATPTLGFDLASGPDMHGETVIDKATGEIISQTIRAATTAPKEDDELDEDGVPYKATPAQSS